MTKCTFGHTLSAWEPIGNHIGVVCFRFVDQHVEKSSFSILIPLSNVVLLWEVRTAESEPGRATWGVKWLPTEQVRGSGSKSFADRFCLAAGAMEKFGAQPEIKSIQRSKSI